MQHFSQSDSDAQGASKRSVVSPTSVNKAAVGKEAAVTLLVALLVMEHLV